MTARDPGGLTASTSFELSVEFMGGGGYEPLSMPMFEMGAALAPEDDAGTTSQTVEGDGVTTH